MATMRAPLSRDAIVAAARHLLAEEGLEAVTLRRVAAALDVTAPALYAHVSDKRDLLRAVAEQELAALVERFEAADDPDPVARMRAYAHCYVDHARQNPNLFRVLFLFPPDVGVGRPTGAEEPAATRAFALPARACVEAVEQGRFGDVDPVLASLTTWSAIHGVTTVLQLGFAFDRATEDALVDSVVETTLRGLAP